MHRQEPIYVGSAQSTLPFFAYDAPGANYDEESKQKRCWVGPLGGQRQRDTIGTLVTAGGGVKG